jgi:hypothetical protein
VPEAVLWAPERYVSARQSDSEPAVASIKDVLWLPTVEEMFSTSSYAYAAVEETAANQARLEYYDTETKRVKKYMPSTGMSPWHWLATPYYGSASFSLVFTDGTATVYAAASAGGCAPAFCVK